MVAQILIVLKNDKKILIFEDPELIQKQPPETNEQRIGLLNKYLLLMLR